MAQYVLPTATVARAAWRWGLDVDDAFQAAALALWRAKEEDPARRRVIARSAVRDMARSRSYRAGGIVGGPKRQSPDLAPMPAWAWEVATPELSPEDAVVAALTARAELSAVRARLGSSHQAALDSVLEVFGVAGVEGLGEALARAGVSASRWRRVVLACRSPKPEPEPRPARPRRSRRRSGRSRRRWGPGPGQLSLWPEAA